MVSKRAKRRGGVDGESPDQQLRDEHELVLVVVEAMEREVAFIEREGRVHTKRVAQMVDFTRNFTDGCHHAKEERLLFPLLEERERSAGGPVSVMLSEHEAGRQAIRAIDEALPRANEDAAARAAVAENLGLYADLLRLHINKENTVLFPLADRILGGRRPGTSGGRVRTRRAGGDRRRRARALPRAGARAWSRVSGRVTARGWTVPQADPLPSAVGSQRCCTA